MDPKTQEILERIIRREELSLWQYVADSYPWTPTSEEHAWGQIKTMIEEERTATANLVRFLTEHRVAPPYAGTYPAWFTSINYISLDELRVRLAEFQKRSIAALKRDLAGLEDPEARALVAKLDEMKRRHLQILEELGAARAEPAVR